jgi:hypothetical protein
MSGNFIADAQQGIVNAMLADPDVANIQLLTADSDELKDTTTAYVGLEISREHPPQSRCFVLDGQIIVRVNRSAYTAEESATIRQNILAALLNPVSEQNFSAFSYESASVFGFRYSGHNVTFVEEVRIDVFAFQLWATQIEN